MSFDEVVDILARSLIFFDEIVWMAPVQPLLWWWSMSYRISSAGLGLYFEAKKNLAKCEAFCGS